MFCKFLGVAMQFKAELLQEERHFGAILYICTWGNVFFFGESVCEGGGELISI